MTERNRQIDGEIERNRQIDGETDRHIDRQRNRHTEKQTDRDTKRHWRNDRVHWTAAFLRSALSHRRLKTSGQTDRLPGRQTHILG